MGMLLSVRGIRKSFGAVAALRHADLDMAEGEVVALLGDNGAGKSTFVRLLSGAGRPDGGTFRFGGNPVDLAKYSVRKARDMGIETVHQDRCLCEGQSLWRNMFVGRHVRTRWGFIDIAAEREATRVMLGEWLGLGGAGLDPDADVRVLSGGERQALAIGRAMYFGARLVILDEPTTALDVTVQAQILDLLREMQDRVGASIIMITHDLGVVAEVSDKVAVMYAGRKVEEGSVEQILFNPQHPYTKALKGCIPHLQRTPASGRHRLHEIPGMVLGMAELGKDRCSFYERCPCGKPECMEHNPPAKAIDAGHEVACWLYS